LQGARQTIGTGTCNLQLATCTIMNRRATLKNLLAGAAGAALLTQATACEAPADMAKVTEAKAAGYGLRMPHELKHDARRFGRYFSELTAAERIEIVDDIAYPEDAEGTEFEAGAKFFDRVRYLTLTGYFTSKKGIKTLNYQGNAPNVWDGVPQEVLDKHGLAYDPKYADKYVDQSKRDVQAEWDDDMNLIS